MRRWMAGIVTAGIVGLWGGAVDGSHRTAQRPQPEAAFAHVGSLVSPLVVRSETDQIVADRRYRGGRYYRSGWNRYRAGDYYRSGRPYYGDRYYRSYYGPGYFPPGYGPRYVPYGVRPGFGGYRSGIWISF